MVEKPFDHKCRLVTKERGVWDYDRAYFFSYRANEDMEFEFSLLCEVGQPFIPTFQRMIKDQKLDLVQVEIPVRPWIITVERAAAKRRRLPYTEVHP